MKRFSKILVATDFSPASHEAARVAADLSRVYAAPLTLVHVVEPDYQSAAFGFGSVGDDYASSVFADARAQLRSARAEARGAGAFAVGVALLQGVVTAQLEAFVAGGGYDLVVVGEHGRSGRAHARMGSVAACLARAAVCPVVTVPAPDLRRAGSPPRSAA